MNRKTMKKTNKNNSTKKMHGGMFNTEQEAKLTKTLKKIWKKSHSELHDKELKTIMDKLGKGSQLFSRSSGLKQLRQQISPLNKEQFKIWLIKIYPLFVEDSDETDFESADSMNSVSTNSTSSSASM
jgi:hypothetical protein